MGCPKGLVKVANNTRKDFASLHAEAWIYNMDGAETSHQEATVNAGADQNKEAVGTLTLTIQLENPTSQIALIAAVNLLPIRSQQR